MHVSWYELGESAELGELFDTVRRNGMSGQLFRKRSMEKISSPEQLNDYIRVSSPSMFAVLSAVIIFIVGICIWGIFGKLDTSVKAVCECRGGSAICYVKESEISGIRIGMELSVDGEKGTITDIAATPMEVMGSMDSYLLHLGGLAEGEWVYAVKADVSADDGIYAASVITQSVSPIDFMLN